MKNIEIRIAKNGSKRYYVREENGKLTVISRAKAEEIQANNDSKIMTNIFEQVNSPLDIEESQFVARADIETFNPDNRKSVVAHTLTFDEAKKFIDLVNENFAERVVYTEIKSVENRSINLLDTAEDRLRKLRKELETAKYIIETMAKNPKRYEVNLANFAIKKYTDCTNQIKALDAELEQAHEVDAAEYAVSADAQQVAIDAEIELAAQNVTIEQTQSVDAAEKLARYVVTFTTDAGVVSKSYACTYSEVKEIITRQAKIFADSCTRASFDLAEIDGWFLAACYNMKNYQEALKTQVESVPVIMERIALIEKETIDLAAQNVTSPEIEPAQSVEPPIVETVEITEEGNEVRRFTVNNETVSYFNGELNFIKSDTYHASLAAYRNQYVVEVPDGRWKKFLRLDADEFHQIMTERGACSIDEPEPFDITEQCASLNKAAPEGWSVDADNDKFSVKFNGQTVATPDSLVLAKILPPEKFFEQFKPLAGKNFDAAENFIADRQREIEQLIELRKELPPDSDRLKNINELIRENERDMNHTELAS